MRRILVSKAVVGRIDLGSAEAHHLRDVLRLGVGAEVEVFDRAGDSGRGRIVSADGRGVTIEVEKIGRAVAGKCRLTIAAAVPKAARADWMIEKLGELGVDVFIPLMTRRSVVAPKGSAKNERWNRLATESARQSGRAGVMRIERLMELAQLIEQAAPRGSGFGICRRRKNRYQFSKCSRRCRRNLWFWWDPREDGAPRNPRRLKQPEALRCG